MTARFGGRRSKTKPRAQGDADAGDGVHQLSLLPRRSRRPGETSSTIHYSSSSTVVPARHCGAKASDGSAVPGLSVGPCPQDKLPEARSPSPRALKAKQPALRRPSAYAPSALTFGLPGKQRVNLVHPRADLTCWVKDLASNVRNLVMLERFRPNQRRDSAYICFRV